jgi:hypothetical protein
MTLIPHLSICLTLYEGTKPLMNFTDSWTIPPILVPNLSAALPMMESLIQLDEQLLSILSSIKVSQVNAWLAEQTGPEAVLIICRSDGSTDKRSWHRYTVALNMSRSNAETP